MRPGSIWSLVKRVKLSPLLLSQMEERMEQEEQRRRQQDKSRDKSRALREEGKEGRFNRKDQQQTNTGIK